MSVNEVRLMGNLGADPDLRFTATNRAVATLSIATSRKYKDKNDDLIEDTQWHRVIVWGPQAETVAKHKKKGDQLYIAGRLEHRVYDKPDGSKGYVTEVVAQDVQFTGRAPSSRPSHPADGPEPASSSARQNGGRSNGRPDDGPGGNDGYIPTGPGDDDIPF